MFWTSLGTSLVPLSLAWLGIHYFGQGLFWCWTLITLWVCSAGLIYLARFLQGKWRTMRVIEPEVASEISSPGTGGLMTAVDCRPIFPP